MSSNDDLLRKATEAAREGKKKEAYSYLEEILETDEENIRAWMLLYRVTDDINEKKIALTTVLQLDPSNVKAQEALSKLEGKLSRDKEELAPGISRRQVTMLIGGVVGGILLIIVLIIGINASRSSQNAQATREAVALVATQTAFEIQKTTSLETSTALAVAATETQFAITSPTPTATSTSNRPTLPPTFTHTPTHTPLVTPTPLPQPAGLPGTIVAWGGPDMLNDGAQPIIALALNGGGQFREISLGQRGQGVAATSLNNVVYSRYFRDVFAWALQKIDVSQGTTSILSVNWEGQTQQRFETSAEPQYSGDGTKLVFTAIDSSNAKKTVYLYDQSAAPGTDPIKKLTTDGKIYESPTISPDGNTVVVVQIDDNPLAPSRDLVYINVQTLEVRPLTTDGLAILEYSPRWSPDGQVLTYAAATEGDPNNRDIYIRTADGTGGALNVTNDPADDIYPVFSPDTNFVAFTSNRAGSYNIYIYNLSQGVTFQLTAQQDDFYPGAWVP